MAEATREAAEQQDEIADDLQKIFVRSLRPRDVSRTALSAEGSADSLRVAIRKRNLPPAADKAPDVSGASIAPPKLIHAFGFLAIV